MTAIKSNDKDPQKHHSNMVSISLDSTQKMQWSNRKLFPDRCANPASAEMLRRPRFDVIHVMRPHGVASVHLYQNVDMRTSKLPAVPLCLSHVYRSKPSMCFGRSMLQEDLPCRCVCPKSTATPVRSSANTYAALMAVPLCLSQVYRSKPSVCLGRLTDVETLTLP